MDEVILHVEELVVDADAGLDGRVVADAVGRALPAPLDAEVLARIGAAVTTSPPIDLAIQEARRQDQGRRGAWREEP